MLIYPHQYDFKRKSHRTLTNQIIFILLVLYNSSVIIFSKTNFKNTKKWTRRT